MISPRDLLRPGPRERPRPQVRIELTRSVPAWLLRALAGAVVVGAGTWLTGDWIAPTLVGLVVALVASTGTAAGLAVLAAFVLISRPPDLATCAVLTATVHAVLVLMRLTAPLTPTGRVELALLGRAAAGFVVIQLLAQAFVGLAFAAALGMPSAPWLGVPALALTIVAVVAGVRWVGRHTQ